MKNKNGFTLIELMVVMTIIVVITAIGMVSYSVASVKSRDGRRMADLQKISLALEMYKQEKGIYPTTPNDLISPTPYLQTWPSDPKFGIGYSYDYARVNIYDVGSSYAYKLTARVENLGSTNISETTGCGGNKCNYRVNNP